MQNYRRKKQEMATEIFAKEIIGDKAIIEEKYFEHCFNLLTASITELTAVHRKKF